MLLIGAVLIGGVFDSVDGTNGMVVVVVVVVGAVVDSGGSGCCCSCCGGEKSVPLIEVSP